MNALVCPDAAFVLLLLFLVIHSVLDGYALGIGILVPWLHEKRVTDQLVEHIAPFWEANEVWLIIAVGFFFAAFPTVYALVMSAFYLPVMAMIGGLLLRAMALEFSYLDGVRLCFWRRVMGLGSLLVILMSSWVLGWVLQGVCFVAPEEICLRLTLDGLCLPLLLGLAGVAFFVWHGMLHARMGARAAPLARVAGWAWLFSLVLGVMVAGCWVWRMPLLLSKPLFWLGGGMWFMGLLGSRLLAGCEFWGFRVSALSMLGFWIAVAAGLYPDLLIATNHPEWTISIQQGAAQVSALRVVMFAAPVMMAVIACYSYGIQKVIRR